MSFTRATAGAVLVLRVSHGLALIAAPRRLALRWLGEAANDAPERVAEGTKKNQRNRLDDLTLKLRFLRAVEKHRDKDEPVQSSDNCGHAPRDDQDGAGCS